MVLIHIQEILKEWPRSDAKRLCLTVGVTAPLEFARRVKRMVFPKSSGPVGTKYPDQAASKPPRPVRKTTKQIRAAAIAAPLFRVLWLALAQHLCQGPSLQSTEAQSGFAGKSQAEYM